MKTDKSIQRLYRKATSFREVDDIYKANADKQEDHMDEWKLIRYAVVRTEELIESGLAAAPSELPEENRYRACANNAQMLDVDDDYELIDRWTAMSGAAPHTKSTDTRRLADRVARADELRAAGVLS